MSVIKRIGATLSVVALTTLAGCASGPHPGPTAIPLRPTEAADFEVADIEALMTQMVDAGAPAVLVEIRDGEHVWSGVQGVRSKKTELPAKITDPTRIASLTKPMVATILLQLVEEGLVQLGDPIEDYLPGIVEVREVTVRQLLNHSSGLPDYVPTLALEDPSAFTTQIVSPISHEELVQRALTQGWSFDPGTGWEYSNTNYIVLTMLIEELTSSTLAEQLQQRITEPLGLTSTTLPAGTSMPENAAHGYVTEGALSIDVTEQDASLWSGAGGVVSTVSDVNTFMRALLTGELIAPELLGQMLNLLPQGYGLGVQSRTDTCPAGDPVYLESSANQAVETAAPGATDATPAATGPAEPAESLPSYDFEVPEEGSGSVHDSDFGELVQIGAPNHVYGHLGSGLGYRGLTMSSPDGIRQVTILWTVSPTDYSQDSRLDLAYELADVALAIDC
ncbi:serine hydrolase domain-containing protein [Gulosibacter chungangensis]|nr:serine hydrolase domain-containing protein [Gulosibacter chungangensis]